MRILISGATGLLGTNLIAHLRENGHETTRLVRSNARESDILWDATKELGAAQVEGFDAVIHLAGEPISKRWTSSQQRRIRDSRVLGTRNLVAGVIAADRRPKSLLCASAVGIYGNRGDNLLDESAPPGEGFLADVAKEWEAEAKPAADAGIRVTNLRTAMVLDAKGGALAAMLPIFRIGLGGRMGDGTQYWSWISAVDWIRAVNHVLMSESISGPVNLSSPNPVTNREFTTTLAGVLRRPALLPAPAFALRLFMGRMANELLLSSARAVPKKLLESGFEFMHADLEAALRWALSGPGCAAQPSP